jgi:hypothetical protein
VQPIPRNYRRRSLGVAIYLSPVGVLVASIVYGAVRGTGLTAGLALVLFAALFAALNLHLSFTHPLLYRWTHGSMAGYRFVSGIPLVGAFFVVAGVLVWFGDVVTASVGLGVLLVDTGGPVWFLVMTWKDASFWDA